jgi:tetratricopeptide (TPR) repeat protein
MRFADPRRRGRVTEAPAGAPLQLRPRSAERQRVWYIGGRPPESDGRSLRLAVRPDRQEAFASLEAIVGQLAPHATAADSSALARMARYLDEVRPGSERLRGGGTRGRLLKDSVTFAIMRRVSRESYYTARVIDLGARTLNAILAGLPHESVHVEHADRLDRPTLKVLARAMLLLEPSHRFSWAWHLDGDPTTTAPAAAASDLYLASRTALLRQLGAMLSPRAIRGSPTSGVRRPDLPANGATTDDMASELVLQNYDRCFLLREPLLRTGGDAAAGEIQRLTGLAAVNVGLVGDALEALRIAETGAGPGRRAHLSYLQGLIEGKRRYDLSASCAHYERGLALIESGDDGEADLPLERGWLLNGLALNEAILWRREPDADERHANAFRLEREAFDLVREGSSPSRMYLRFNLLANSALLMEMCGEYDVAIDLFRRTFDFDVDRDSAKRSRWESTMGYRLGVLHYRAGRLDEAYRLLYDAAEQDESVEGWPTRERILRALGAVALDRGAAGEAESLFRRGLETCREARAAEGTRAHAEGLVAALLSGGRAGRAAEVLRELREEEGLAIASRPDDVPRRPPSPKLPAYFPEIDLEGIPAIDLNRFLGASPTNGAFEPMPWPS